MYTSIVNHHQQPSRLSVVYLLVSLSLPTPKSPISWHRALMLQCLKVFLKFVHTPSRPYKLVMTTRSYITANTTTRVVCLTWQIRATNILLKFHFNRTINKKYMIRIKLILNTQTCLSSNQRQRTTILKLLFAFYGYRISLLYNFAKLICGVIPMYAQFSCATGASFHSYFIPFDHWKWSKKSILSLCKCGRPHKVRVYTQQQSLCISHSKYLSTGVYWKISFKSD